ncbi:hypothetical protein [Maribacter sp. Asnod1-A12]|uniref:hypothetical protein n=1 Tax=Maribacter sp. Asnod1-A12 TaxID=3160576 RepID=UPI00386C5AC9
MKRITILCVVLLCFYLSSNITYAQDSLQTDAREKKRLLLNQFESDMVLTASERVALKQSRLAHQHKTKSILDTLDISEARRNRLLQELKRNPFSEKIKEVIANHTKSKDTIEQ